MRSTAVQASRKVSAAFLDQAQSIAKASGFESYDLVDVRVGGDLHIAPSPVLMGRMAMAADAQSLPVAARMESVSVQVSGRIRLR